MAENKNKYVSPSKLSIFLDNLRDIFSPLVHEHKITDLTDYTVDTALSPDSSNPVENRVIDAEFEAISEALNVYDIALDDKIDKVNIVDNLTTTTTDQPLSANQGNVLHNQIEEINEKLAELMYKPIIISSFTISELTSTGTGDTFTKSPVELGSTVTSVTLSWETNKAPSTLTIDGTAMDVSQTSYIYNDLNLTSNKTYTIKATDERGASADDDATLIFCNRVCYGVAVAPATINSDFVMGLAAKTLSTTKARIIDCNAGEGQYIWYCVPTRLGQCSFIDTETGLGAGLSLVDTVSVTNASGYTENYYVYKSDYAGLGSLTIKVS